MSNTTGNLPPWAVDDDSALNALPKTGFLKEYVETVKDWTDCPAIYHIGSSLSMLATLSGKCTLRVRLSDKMNNYIPIRLWSAVIGDSGDRKSQAMRIAQKCMTHGLDELFLPADGSLEAWHDSLAGSLNPRMLHYDELSKLFEMSKRSYTAGTHGWLMGLWEGNNHTRVTKAKGEVTIYTPRLSVLGGIPPTTFAQKTEKGDWASGFLARWGYFAGRRVRYLPIPYYDDDIQETMNEWASTVPWQSDGHIIIDKLATDAVVDWMGKYVEGKRDTVNPNLFSTLNRLQDLTFTYSALIEMSKQARPVNQHLYVTQESCREALHIIELLYGTLVGLFLTVSSNHDTREEKDVLDAMSVLGRRCTINQICEKTGLGRPAVKKILDMLKDDGEIIAEVPKAKTRGRPPKLYSRL